MKQAVERRYIQPVRMNYAYYYSGARTAARPAITPRNQSVPKQRRITKSLLVVAVLVVLGGSGVSFANSHHSDDTNAAATPATSTTTTTTHSTTAPAVQSASTNVCAGNTVSKKVIVSISQRHLWACAGSSYQYDSPIVTGISYLAADKTPTGTYTISNKTTDTTLTGSDSTGSWSDPVSYWMPFLHNQYGDYGFHDATWRSNSDFGNISPNSSKGSHGCVELPLATAQWLYGWADVGTTVDIKA